MHDAVPGKALTVPGEHTTHVSLEFAPVAAEAVVAGQSEHAVAPLASLKRPGAQVVQLGAPLSADAVPGAHGLQDDAPRDEKLPGEHATQTLGEVAPTAAEDVPGVHGVQDVAPWAALHVPGGQLEHTGEPSPAEYDPMPHTLQNPMPAKLEEPALHGAHAVDPTDALYVPAAQYAQVALVVAPRAVLAVPDLHGLHAVPAALQVPWGHVAQDTGSAETCTEPATHVQVVEPTLLHVP